MYAQNPCLILQEIVTPDMLYEEVIEVEEQVVLSQDKCQINKQCPVVMGTTGEKVFNENDTFENENIVMMGILYWIFKWI